MKYNKYIKPWAVIVSIVVCINISGCNIEDLSSDLIGSKTDQTEEVKHYPSILIEDVPDYSGDPYVVINDNVPDFTDDEKGSTESFEQFSDLDSLGRCGTVSANIGTDLMPVEERGSIGQIKPSGWHTIKYDIVDGKFLYNRCHLIGYQLTGENSNEKNLITGTRYMNTQGMLPFENDVADYVQDTGNHVLYRATPVFQGNELVARGVQMEAYSVEDDGKGISFNVFVYNVQPGIDINYLTGESSLASDNVPDQDIGDANNNVTETEDNTGRSDVDQNNNQQEIRGNVKSKIYHCPGQMAYDQMADSKNLVIFQSEQEAIDAGYRKAQR